MLWGRLTTIAIIAIRILDPCSYRRKASVETGIFPSLRIYPQILDKMVYK
jgi:hypothetical protein